MKPIKKPFVKSSQKPQCVSDGKSRSNMINNFGFRKRARNLPCSLIRIYFTVSGLIGHYKA